MAHSIYFECVKLFKRMLIIYDSKTFNLRYKWSFSANSFNRYSKTMKIPRFQPLPKCDYLEFVWVNQNIFLNVSTNFKPAISFVSVKIIFVYLHWNDNLCKQGWYTTLFLNYSSRSCCENVEQHMLSIIMGSLLTILF